MTFEEKKAGLKEIYERFETDAIEYKQHAICKIGCCYCCTNAGSVDIITLEGLIIGRHIKRLSTTLKIKIRKKLAKNRREKENHHIVQCPFLKSDNTCAIYAIRPFSCRKTYSLQECRGRGPTIHRQVFELANKAVKQMQQLDNTGYSGHISFILYLLDNQVFKKLYLSGKFDPGRIKEFGKTHNIIINRLTSKS